jgi:serpin B
MAPAFGGTYDDISPSLTLTAVEQQGFVSVSEKGTEAAAATVAVFDESASEPPFGPIVIDRPFLWLIRESDGGAVLFAGVVTDPR